MDDTQREAIATSLGNPTRDFKKEPLTQDEITAVIHTYTEEIHRIDIHPELKEIYIKCLEILKNHLLLH
jgi:hypothetical protein